MTAIARSLCLAGVCALTARVAAADERTDFFEKNIRPVLVTQCAECHSGDTPEGDLLLGTREAIIKGGMNGPSLKPGIPEASLIFTRLITEDDDLLMPPEKPLTKQQIHDFHATILHLLGFDQTKLTHFYGDRDFRLTGLAGKAVHDILA